MIWYIVAGAGLALLLAHTVATTSASVTGYRSTIRAVAGIDVEGNARQIKEGYFLTSMIEERHVANIHRQGVRVVISAVNPSDETVAALRRAGIEWVPVPLGSTFLHADTIHATLERYAPERTLIHCQHGVDRTGNIAAFALVTQHDWKVDDALYAVVNPVAADTTGLGQVLDYWDAGAPRSPRFAGVGIYSLAGIGKSGGMKARDDDYRQLISTNIQAMRSYV
jgi:hypothetical protein